jgi:hypothetical protein
MAGSIAIAAALTVQDGCPEADNQKRLSEGRQPKTVV